MKTESLPPAQLQLAIAANLAQISGYSGFAAQLVVMLKQQMGVTAKGG